MTELAQYAGPGSVEQAAQPSSLVSWADGATAAYRVAQQLVETSFVPQGFRNKPFEATAAILSGQEIGLSPMASLRSFDVIQGIAAPRAITLRAIVQSRGHRMWVAEANKTRAVVRGIRAGETQVQESVWTIDRAKELGLTGKDNWRKQPQAMLVARATAECARLIAADAIHGIPYVAEELDDQGEVEPEPTQTVKPAAKRVARRAPVEPKPPAPVEEPAFDDTPDWAPQPEPQPQRKSAYSVAGNRPAGDDRPATPKQVGEVARLCNEIGLNTDTDQGREEAMRVISTHIGRQITSRKQLSFAEASSVIDQFRADVNARQEAQQPDEPTLDEQ